MSDTPRTETYVLNPLPQIVSAEWARQLELELNEVTKERDEAVFVTEKVLRDFSEHSRSHCKALDELIAANNRIKRLEEAGDAMAKDFAHFWTDRNSVRDWPKAKEAKL